MVWKYPFILTMLLGLMLPIQGEVFTLWPYSGGGSAKSYKLESLPGIDPKILYSEPMIVNGARMDLEVYRINSIYDNLILFLKSNFDSKDLQAAGDTIRVAFKVNDKQVERWLIVFSGEGKPLTLFRVVSPLQLPEPGEWPALLPPLPPGARITKVVEFSKRKSVYGFFKGGEVTPDALLRSTSDYLRTNGWQPVGNEADSSIQGNGDLFLRVKSHELMWVNYGASGTGACYTRPYP